MAKSKTSAKIVTCGEYVARLTDPKSDKRFTFGEDGKPTKTIRSKTCHRLPNHRGDCRVTLHQPKEPKAPAPAKSAPKTASATTKSAPAKTVDAAVLIAAIEDGSMTPSEALALIAASKKRPASKTTSTKSKTATKTSKTTDLPVVWGCNARTKSGQIGKVVKIDEDRVTLRMADKSNKTFVLSAVTRVAPKAAAVA